MTTGGLQCAAPSVSVVMIFLDASAFMAAAIDSVLAQSCRDWELILVDDGSTDGSTTVALHYARLHADRIRYIDHEEHANLGTGMSRNAGIAAARGRYVAFLDADDEFMPARLQRHLDAFALHPDVGVVISGDLYWHSWHPEADAAADHMVIVWAPFQVPIAAPELLESILVTHRAPLPTPGAVTFRRDVALAAGGIPRAFRDQYEDQVLLSQLLMRTSALVLNACLSRYRQHPGSLTARAQRIGAYRPGRAHEARFVFLEWLQVALREQGINRPQIDRSLRRKLWSQRHPRLNALYEAWLDTARAVVGVLLPPAIRLRIERSLWRRARGKAWQPPGSRAPS